MEFVKNQLPTDEETHLFFKALPVVPQPRFAKLRAEPLVPETTGEDAFIGAKSPIVVAFADGVSLENRKAVMYSVQFAEKYSDTVASRKYEPIKWYMAYGVAINNCGWFTPSFIFTDHDTSKINVTMDSLVLDIIAQVAGINAAAFLPLLSKVFDTIKKDNALITLFDNNSKGDNVGSFQLVPCLESKEGIPVAVFAGLECAFKSVEGGAWFWKWKSSNLKVQKASSMINMNYDSYKRVEPMILDWLGQEQDDFFKSLKKP
ncbi:hypothetical protein [Pseudomonas psychrophila]|uniref:hypothetical protein n=1 Tax=Pseudomonas psychrophila TaxID=122355 RepID=UPI0003659018|nr:hypothetical protein [Pseudomonas psychrophila]